MQTGGSTCTRTISYSRSCNTLRCNQGMQKFPYMIPFYLVNVLVIVIIIWCTNYLSLYVEFSAWTLVSENQECGGSEIRKSLRPGAGVQDCATECGGVSSMFLFSPRWNSCYCETSAAADGTCDIIDIPNYNLYKYGKYSIYMETSILNIY